jgi:hypothetical protein
MKVMKALSFRKEALWRGYKKVVTWHLKLYEAKERKVEPGVFSWRCLKTIAEARGNPREPPEQLVYRANGYSKTNGVPIVPDAKHGKQVPLSAMEVFALLTKEAGDEETTCE